MDKQDQQFFQQVARDDLLAYAVYCDRFFEIAPHHELIAEHLNKVVTGEIQNLIISMPPRAWKSRLMQEFISKLYGDTPKTDILYAGHSLNLLEGFSRNIRNRVQSQEFQSLYNTKIASDSASVKNWNVEKGGEFAIYGVGGWITGKGWDILIIDDPYATRQEAESETVRRTVSDWYWSTFLTRKQNDKSKQIIIMQRWRQDDLAGEILEKEWQKWTELKIPALDEKDESFWASRFSSEYFRDIREKQPLFFASQYQQEPVNNQWNEFKKDDFVYYTEEEYEVAKKYLKIVTFLDPAISERQEADDTAFVTVGIDSRSNNIYVLDVEAWHMLPDKIIDTAFDKIMKWWGKLWVEDIQYQRMLIIEIKKQMRVRNRFFVLESVRPQGEKNSRIRSILSWRYSGHSILHKKTMQAMETQLLAFPKWKHDDMIDALASAVTLCEVKNIDREWAGNITVSLDDVI